MNGGFQGNIEMVVASITLEQLNCCQFFGGIMAKDSFNWGSEEALHQA